MASWTMRPDPAPGLLHHHGHLAANVLSGMQFRRTGGSAEYNSVNVASMEEAERLLDELK